MVVVVPIFLLLFFLFFFLVLVRKQGHLEDDPGSLEDMLAWWVVGGWVGWVGGKWRWLMRANALTLDVANDQGALQQPAVQLGRGQHDALLRLLLLVVCLVRVRGVVVIVVVVVHRANPRGRGEGQKNGRAPARTDRTRTLPLFFGVG